MSDMSDSENELVPSNVLTFQSQGTTVSAKGPNINSTSISSLSFRNNALTSTMNMPWNMETRRHPDVLFDQRSVGYRKDREMSPLSYHSASGMQPRNYNKSFYPSGGMSSHRSMYNGRGGSPMSVRSSRTIDSNTSMSAKDIALAFQMGNFNKFDFKIIKEAYNKYMKNRLRRRVEKKRNIRMFLKGFRRRSGGDSGDQASNSSISSDDCKSIRSSRSVLHKDIMPTYRSSGREALDARQSVRENDIVRDRTQEFRHNSFRSMFQMGSMNAKDSNETRCASWQNASINLQKERLKSIFLLPSQRFNQSVSSIKESSSRLQNICENNMLDTRNSNQQKEKKATSDVESSDSECDDIFGEKTIIENNNNRKRCLEKGNVSVSDVKRSKLSPLSKTPKEKQTSSKKVNQLNTSIKQVPSDFIFAKPQLPIKKIGLVKNTNKSVKPPKLHEKSKSLEDTRPICANAESSTENVSTNPDKPVEQLISSSHKAQEKLITNKTQLDIEPNVSSVVGINVTKDSTQLSTTDMSMRPSFIKRKLFSQKIDETAKNSSSDSLQADSPQNNIYSKIQKEKNKARKLATQSCLNREVGDDSNLLDLIHKVVPPNRMNVTVANKTDIKNDKSKKVGNTSDKLDKWDVTSIISTCTNDNVSDTFTDDEEIFSNNENRKKDTKCSNEKGKFEGTCSTHKDKIKISDSNSLHLNTLYSKEKENETVEINSNKVIIEKNSKTKNKNQSTEVLTTSSVEAESNLLTKPLNKKQEKSMTEKQIKAKKQITNEKETKNVLEKQKNNVCEKLTKTLKTKGCKVSDTDQTKQPNTPAKNSKCLVILQKLTPPCDQTSPSERNGLIKANVYKGVMSFWDTDTEGDFEVTPAKARTPVKNGFHDCEKQKVIDTVVNDMSDSIKQKLDKTLENLQKKFNKSNEGINLQRESKNTCSGTQIQRPKNGTTRNAVIKETPIKNTHLNPIKGNMIENEAVKDIAKKRTMNKKVCPSSKENVRPDNKPLQTDNNQIDPSKERESKEFNTKQKLNTSDKVLEYEKCRHLKVNNNTLRIHPKRSSKRNSCKCCAAPDSSEASVNDSSLYRSLRSRQVDLSTSLRSDVDTALPKTTIKNKRLNTKTICKEKGDTTASDLSFTLAADVPPANRTLRTRQTSNMKAPQTRKSNVSFSLTSDEKALNVSRLDRSTKRIREVEALQNSSASFYKNLRSVNRSKTRR